MITKKKECKPNYGQSLSYLDRKYLMKNLHALFMPQIFFHFLQRKAQNIMKLFEVCVTSKQKAEDTNIVT